MIFTLVLDRVPQNGNELADLIRQAAESVRHNIGPEPLRFTTGPIYDGPPGRAASGQRCGTWGIAERAQNGAA